MALDELIPITAIPKRKQVQRIGKCNSAGQLSTQQISILDITRQFGGFHTVFCRIKFFQDALIAP